MGQTVPKAFGITIKIIIIHTWKW